MVLPATVESMLPLMLHDCQLAVVHAAGAYWVACDAWRVAQQLNGPQL
jgi:hypothetical protein